MIALTRPVRTRLPAPPPPGEPNLWPGMSLTHVGFMVRVHIQLAFAGTMVLHDRFDARWCLAQLQRLRPARLGGFPPVLVMLMRDPEFAAPRLVVRQGGAPSAARRWRQHLVDEIRAKLGVDVFTGYSCTETAIISATLAERSARAPRRHGRPADRRASRCASSTTQRRPLPAGEPGRIAVRSPATMRGYWRRPEETAARARRRRLALHRGHGLPRRARLPAPARAREGHVLPRRLQRVPRRGRGRAADAPQGRAGGGARRARRRARPEGLGLRRADRRRPIRRPSTSCAPTSAPSWPATSAPTA